MSITNVLENIYRPLMLICIAISKMIKEYKKPVTLTELELVRDIAISNDGVCCQILGNVNCSTALHLLSVMRLLLLTFH